MSYNFSNNILCKKHNIHGKYLLIDLHFQFFLFSVFTAHRLPKYERNIRLKRFMENGETAERPKLYEIYLTFKFRFPTFRFCILTGNGYCYW